MRTRIVCLPPLEDSTVAVSRLSQLAFYLHPIDLERVTVVASNGSLDLKSLRNALPPTSVVHENREFYDRFASRVNIVGRTEDDATTLLANADVALIWGTNGIDDETAAILDNSAIHTVSLNGENADSQHDHRALLRLGSRLRGDRQQASARSRRRFKAFLDNIGPQPLACVFLGHSLQLKAGASNGIVGLGEAGSIPSSHDGPRVIYLSAPELYLPSPAGTPIHMDLGHAANAEQTLLVVPDWAHGECTRMWPDLSDRIVGLPHEPSTSVTADLHSRFSVSDRGPKATTLLALATAIARDIHIVVSEEDDTSDATWESALLAIERKGGRVSVSGPATSPALRRRTPSQSEATQISVGREDPGHLLVSINPDWMNEMGHHAHFDRTMREAAKASDDELLSLTGKALRPDGGTWQIPTFTHPTYGFDNAESRVFLETFEQELELALTRLLARFPGIPLRVMMYSAGLTHLVSLIAVAVRLDEPRVSFFVNLLRAHNDLLELESASLPTYSWLLLREAINIGPNVGVHTMVDTEELGDIVAAVFGSRLQMWPMVGVTQLDQGDASPPHSTPLTLCYPATQVVKGLDLFADLAELIANDGNSVDLKLIARDTGHSPEFAERLAAVGVELTSGVLTSAEYAAFMESADIIALPYRSKPFRIQTSGVLADAVKLRKPMVATRSTWAGHIVDKHGIGATFDEGDLKGFHRAVIEVANDYERLLDRMAEFAPNWLAANNPYALLEAFEYAESNAPDRSSQIDRIELLQAVQTIVDLSVGRRARADATGFAVLDQQALDLKAENARIVQKLGARDRSVERLEATVVDIKTDRDRKVAKLDDQLAKSVTRIETRDRELLDLQERLEDVEARLAAALVHHESIRSLLQQRIETRQETIGHLKLAVRVRDEKLAATKTTYEHRIETLKVGTKRRDATIAALNRKPSIRLGRALRRIIGR